MIPITDFQLLVGAAIFCTIMITLSGIGYRAHLRYRKRAWLDAVAVDMRRQRAVPQLAPPMLTVTKVGSLTAFPPGFGENKMEGSAHE